MINIVIADYQNKQHELALITMMQHYAYDPMGGSQPLSDYVIENLAKALNKIEGAFTVLAFDGDDPVGLINCLPGFSTFYCKPLLNIHDAVIKESYRGQKLVQQLLAVVEDEAYKMNCCKMTLEVLEGNEMAKSAYKRFGFSGYSLDPNMGNALFWDKKLTLKD